MFFWEQRLCRICGLVGEMCYPIFAKDSNRNLEMKLRKYLSLNVLKEDFKPKEVCNECLVKLESFVEFVELCYATNEKFEGILYHSQQNGLLQPRWNGKVCDVDPKSGVIVASSNKDNQQDFADCSDIIMMVQYKDMLPGVNLDVPCALNEQDVLNIVNTNFTNQMEIGYTNKYAGYEQNQTVLRHSGKSNYCQQNGVSYGKYKNSVDNSYIDVQSKETASYLPEPEEMPVFVNETTISLVDNEPVKKAKKGKTLKGSLVSVESVKNAVKTAGKGDEKFESRRPVDAKQLKKYTCAHCNKCFVRKLNLNAHIALHTNVRPHVCNICDKSFAVRWDLTRHQRVHTDLYRCNYCSKPFSVSSKLERHIRIHTNERPYVCPEKDCGKTFSDKRNLVGHKLTHSDQRDFRCEICEKCYKTKSQLNDHKRAHSEDAPYSCDICSKSYKWKTNLLLHIRKHNGYKCLHCKKDCEKLSVLIKHRKECKSGK